MRPASLALCLLAAMAAAGCARGAGRGEHRPPTGGSAEPVGSAPARFLYVWAGDKDEKDSDFLAVVDVRPASATYGQMLATAPVGMRGTMAHHLEYALPAAGQLLYANGHHHEAIFQFDVSDAERPRLVGTASAAPPLRYPHDFVRLPNQHLLVGYLRSEGPSPVPGDSTMPGNSGGVAELTPDGRVVRWGSAADSTLPRPMRPYAFAVLPERDRFVVTSAAMMEASSADAVQVWRLSDLTRLHTLPLPPARLPDGRMLDSGHAQPFEPRVMRDGSVLLNAYGCGFYRMTGIGTDRPAIQNVYTLDVPAGRVPPGRLAGCGVPVVDGRFWVVPVGRLNLLLTLDVSDPARPREVARLQTDSSFRPHWLAKDPGSDRIVVGAENGGEDRMLMARLDARTGALRWDETFRSADGRLGVSFVRDRWPHGLTGEAFGHAALFRP